MFSRDMRLPEEVREILLDLASAYRDRTRALEHLTSKLNDLVSYEKTSRKHEDDSET